MSRSDLEILLFIGVILFLVAVLGGGHEILAIKTPSMGKVPRLLSLGIGAILVGIAGGNLFLLANPANLYDDFDDSTYDGTVDATRWRKNGCADVGQRAGAMVFQSECHLFVGRPSSVALDQLELFEAQVRLASDHNGEVVTQELVLSTADLPGNVWWANCGLIAHSGEINAFFSVTNAGLDESDLSVTFPAEYDRWYTIRLQVDNEQVTFSCFLDNQSLGSVVPKNASFLRDAQFQRKLEAARLPGAFATTLVDDVRMKP